MAAPLGIHRVSTSAMSTLTAATPKETPVASAKKSLSNLKQKLVGPLPIEYLPAEPLNPPKLRTNKSMPALRDKTSLPRLRPEEDDEDDYYDNLFQPSPLPLSPGAASSDAKNGTGPRFMSMEEAGEVNATQVIPRSKHYVVRVKMPTVWGVPPSRKKRRRKAPPRDPRSLRIAKALKRQPELFKSKCKGVFRGFVQKAMEKRLNGCVRALQAEVVEEPEQHDEDEDDEEEESENGIIECKPIYRLREKKRRSLLRGLAKSKRPLSIASMLTASSGGDRRRYSDVSLYSRHMSTPGLPDTSFGEADNEETPSHRVSLVPFREWWGFMHPHNNPFADDSNTTSSTTNIADEQPLSLSSTRAFSASKQEANSIHNEQEDSFHSLFAIPSSSFSTRPTSQPSSFSTLFRSSSSYLDSSEFTDESQAPPSPSSSELTITPLRFSRARKMSDNLHGSEDPVVESMDSKTGLEETVQVERVLEQENDAETGNSPSFLASQEAISSSSEQDYKTRVSPKGDLASEDTRVASDKLSESKGSVSTSHPENYKLEHADLNQGQGQGQSQSQSQLPRSSGKPYPGLGKGMRAIPEYRSAIPIPVNRQGSSSGSETPPSVSNKEHHGVVNTSGSRTHEAHRGPPRPWSPEPIRETGRASPSSSTSASDYGSDDVEFVMQKPKKVFTGEYRTRSDRFRASSYGPTLKIASSADDVIMGPGAAAKSKSSPVSSPTTIKHVERAQTDSPQDTGATPKGKLIPTQDSHSQSASPKTGRPSPSGLPQKRDISNRELMVPRKPLSRPSLNNLYAASAGSPSAEDTPPVPKVPVSGEGGVLKNSPLSTVKMADSSTQTRSPQRERAALGMTPEQLRLLIPIEAYSPPPRTSSLQALAPLSPFEEIDETPHTPGQVQVQDQEDHLEPQLHHQGEYSRLPESKSYRIFGGFRSIFKQRGAAEKTRSKQEETEQHFELFPKEQSIVSVKSIDTSDNNKAETPKPAPKKAGWNKVARNPRLSAKNSPAGSSPLSISSPLSASVNNRPLEIHTPSFARPTHSTRTKSNSNVTGTTAGGSGAGAAAAAPKLPLTSQEGQPRRVIQSAAASTGSPQRPLRANIKRPVSSGIRKPVISSPRPVVSENEQDKTTPRSGDLKKPESAKATFKDIHACIAKLCNKARDESTAHEREKYLRLALSLQQQVSDFNNTEKAAGEAHMIFNSKKFEKDAAHTTLFEYFDQVQAQLNEE